MDGWTIALERIAREAAERNGFIDLGNLGLEALPDELFQLTHLRSFNLGGIYFDWDGRLHEAASDLGANIVRKQEQRLGIGSTVLRVTPPAPAEGTVSIFDRIRREAGGPMSAEPRPALAFAQEPAAAPEWCVSYAWGDDTPEGRAREEVVDRRQRSAASASSATRPRSESATASRDSCYATRCQDIFTVRPRAICRALEAAI